MLKQNELFGVNELLGLTGLGAGDGLLANINAQAIKLIYSH